MAANASLSRAKAVQNDEFYTQYILSKTKTECMKF